MCTPAVEPPLRPEGTPPVSLSVWRASPLCDDADEGVAIYYDLGLMLFGISLLPLHGVNGQRFSAAKAETLLAAAVALEAPGEPEEERRETRQLASDTLRVFARRWGSSDWPMEARLVLGRFDDLVMQDIREIEIAPGLYGCFCRSGDSDEVLLGRSGPAT